MTDSSKLGFLLDGGGARAAYQVGVLRALARAAPDLDIPILTGVSAGAINAAHLASRSGSFADSVDELVSIWERVTIDQVFRVDALSLFSGVLRWGLRLLSGGSRFSPRPRGLVDSTPLRSFLSRWLPQEDGALGEVARNLDRGVLDAVGITTTDYRAGRSITWVEGRDPPIWVRPRRESVPCRMTLEHVLASCALPLLFPAVSIGGAWHGDGGIRLTAPLSPALHLGADRILAISTRSAPSGSTTTPSSDIAPRPQEYPSPAQIASVLMDAIFLDVLEYDAANMARINRLIEGSASGVANGLRRAEVFIIRPTVDFGQLAAEHEAGLPRPFRFLLRGLGTSETQGGDYLSMLLFQPEFIARLIEIGEEDGERRKKELVAFVRGEAPPRAVHESIPEAPAGRST